MKNTLLLSGLLLLGPCLKAQVGGYTFSQFNATYANLGAGKSVVTSAWTNGFNNISITAPVDVDFFGINTSSGSFRLTHMGQMIYQANLTGSDFLLSAMGSELYGVANAQAAEISYLREGTSPNRILKVEYKGAGFTTESPRVSTVNFQIWVHEADDAVEFHYGPSNIQTASAIPGDIGLFEEEVGTVLNSIELFGNPSGPTPAAGNLVDGQHLSAVPAPNTVYRFAPSATSVADPELQAALHVSFSGESRMINITSDARIAAEGYELYNLTGQRLASVKPVPGTTVIDARVLVPGMYIIKALTSRGVANKKVLVN